MRTSSVTAGRAVRLRSVSHSAVISARSGGDRRVALAREQVGVVQPAQGLADALELREHGAALRLGRVRGQDQLDAQRRQQRRHPLAVTRRAPAARATASPTDSPIGRRVLGALALAQGLDAVGLLGQVHQVEVDGERGRGGPRGVDGQRRDLGGQALGGLRLSAAPRLGQGADALLGLEEGDGLLGAQHLAERLAEQMDAGREIHDPTSSPFRRRGVGSRR